MHGENQELYDTSKRKDVLCACFKPQVASCITILSVHFYITNEKWLKFG